ncbi:hypothetical protein AB6A40_002589 [Gnathostoma spinigerum]|uniref:Nuclear autoantigenic sperm protein n=1 Tax=Gnathostoma spinigerum TaxID=75299 RepID=A0ABD6E867_9BILA
MVVIDVSLENGDVAEETREQRLATFQRCFGEGKKAYISGNLNEACDMLGEAAGIAAELYGLFSPEAFLPHFQYGKALLDNARAEEKVFTNALVGVNDDMVIKCEDGADCSHVEGDEKIGDPDDVTDDERKEISEKVDAALEENCSHLEHQNSPSKIVEDDRLIQASKGNAAVEESAEDDKQVCDRVSVTDAAESAGVDEIEQDEGRNSKDRDEIEEEQRKEITCEDRGEQEDDCGERMCEDAHKDECDEEDDDEEAEEEEIEPLQLAWENLEVARSICDRFITEEGWKEKKAEVLLTLGECSIEDGNYKQANDDLSLCIEIQNEVYSSDDRRIAESYFQLARAYSLDKEFEKAAEHYEKAKSILTCKLGSVREEYLKRGESEEDESLKNEIADLQAVISAVQAKVDDSRDSAKNASAVDVAKKLSEHVQQKPSDDISSSVADDITNLVRKKPAKRSAGNGEESHEELIKRTKNDDSLSKIQSAVHEIAE